MSQEQIIMSDYKEFNTEGKKYAVGQVEILDSIEINNRKKEILESMEKLRDKKGLNFILLMVTNIIKEGTDFWAVGDVTVVEKAFGSKFEDGCMWKKGVMSRKKQVVPLIDKVLRND